MKYYIVKIDFSNKTHKIVTSFKSFADARRALSVYPIGYGIFVN